MDDANISVMLGTVLYGLVPHQDEYATLDLDLRPAQPVGYTVPEWSRISASILTWVFT
jgi:hypothetical protein